MFRKYLIVEQLLNISGEKNNSTNVSAARAAPAPPYIFNERN